MIVQKVEMAAGQPLNLGEGILHSLRVEPAPTLKERILIAEVTMLRTAARHHDGVRYQVRSTSNQIAAYWRNSLQSAASRRGVNPLWFAGAKVGEEVWKSLFSRSKKNGVRVPGCLYRQRRHMQPAQADKRSLAPVMIGNPVRPVCIGDVNLDHDQLRRVTKRERLHMLVHNGGVVIGREVGGERGQAQRRKQRILDGAPIRIARLFQGGQNEFDVQRSRTGSDHRPPAVASAGAASGIPPKRRCLPRNSSSAASRSPVSKSGHIRSVNQSSA